MLGSEARKRHLQRSKESLSWGRMTAWQSTTVPVHTPFSEKKDQRSFHFGVLLRVASERWRTGPKLTALSIRSAVMWSFSNWLLNCNEGRALAFGLWTWIHWSKHNRRPKTQDQRPKAKGQRPKTQNTKPKIGDLKCQNMLLNESCPGPVRCRPRT